MALNPDDLKFSKDHLWFSVGGDEAVVGVTDHAQKEMGDVVFLDLSDAGKSFEKGDVIGNIESVKAATDMMAPLAGEVVEVNPNLTNQPDTLNSDPYGDGWIYKIKIGDTASLDELMDYSSYTEFARNQ